MIGPSNAVIGTPFLITFRASLSDVAVTATVMIVESGDSTPVSLTRSTDLSSDDVHVYTGEFTPSETGWIVIRYAAVKDGLTLHSDISRVYVDRASTASGSGSTTGPSAGESTAGATLQVPTILDGTSGTLTFTVGTS